MSDNERQTGRTMKQMMEAPLGSIFITVNASTIYSDNLARFLGRGDLQIIPPSWFNTSRTIGKDVPAVIVDHAALFTDSQYRNYDNAVGRWYRHRTPQVVEPKDKTQLHGKLMVLRLLVDAYKWNQDQLNEWKDVRTISGGDVGEAEKQVQAVMDEMSRLMAQVSSEIENM